MTIYINPFEDIEEVDIEKYSKENPLFYYELPRGIFKKEGNIIQNLLNFDMEHWENLLNNRLHSITNNFAYAMFYYEKGIPDKEWYISPGFKGQSVQFFPHFKEEHYSNQYNFSYFVDTFFLKSFTVFETICHLLFKLFNIEVNKDDWKDQISFHNAVFKLKKINFKLHKDLLKIKKSSEFTKGIKMRNDIAHNHPPYRVSSGVTIGENTYTFGVGEYTTSEEIKKVMIGLLNSIKETFEILSTHFTK
ncbi:Cthe_2314 family HEPN domain-containing protein [Peribacillus butanolivorans]|uniref:Cthe_2314 family HEPN domain-containing protein n=1 Tax=Peribacillus butanolivorans TaxID=421767 RepID=UPI003D276045